MFALRTKNKFEFSCISVSELKLDKAIDSAYWNWRGIQSAGSGHRELEDFMKNKERVKVVVEII